MTQKTRRSILGIGSSAILVGLAGCSGSGNTDGEETTDEDGPGETETDQQSPMPLETQTQTQTQTPTENSGPDHRATLSIGETYEGEITEDSPSEPTYGGLAEPLAFEAERGQSVQITMEAPNFNSWFMVGGPDYITQAGTGGLESETAVNFPEADTYTIWASSNGGSGTGDFTVSVSEIDRGPKLNEVEPAATISFGETYEGEITADSPTIPREEKLGVPIEFTGSEGQEVVIEMRAEFNTYLYLIRPNGNILKTNNDSLRMDDENSRLYAELPVDGPYLIWATSLNDDSTGEFTLSLSEYQQN